MELPTVSSKIVCGKASVNSLLQSRLKNDLEFYRSDFIKSSIARGKRANKQTSLAK